MAYSGLADFVKRLENENELHVVNTFVDPELEIAEITDRVVKSGGRALLFKNNGTKFPVLINAYGSDKRMLLTLERDSYDSAGKEIETLFNNVIGSGRSVFDKLKLLPGIFGMASYFPAFSKSKGRCQEVIDMNPDLSMMPILKCWRYDGGRFITLPMVHTAHTLSGSTNVGMYRMQVIDKNTTGMHWQLHKTGANHYEAWKRENKLMPVSVALGGDPVYAYSASAPLPENINEYILAGFLRKKRVKLVKCITNDLYVPEDADFVLEGYVDPAEDLFMEGSFGDHTGFYSLPDLYPKFHITCITYKKDAVYPATIVGVPPQEDAWLAKATERIFLAPLKMTLQPEITDFHLPDAGVAHNLLIVKINKTYPGQGMKIISALLGAGQMMFSKYIIVVDGNVDIRNYDELARHIFANTSIGADIMFMKGPLDVLDHASDTFAFGGKMGIDSTVKMNEEIVKPPKVYLSANQSVYSEIDKIISAGIAVNANVELMQKGIPVVIFSVNCAADADIVKKLKLHLKNNTIAASSGLVVAVDGAINSNDIYTVVWQTLGNTDPLRDHEYIDNILFINGTTKAFRQGGFTRRWPNVVCSDDNTIKTVDNKWDSLELGSFLPSPSLKLRLLKHGGEDEVITT